MVFVGQEWLFITGEIKDYIHTVFQGIRLPHLFMKSAMGLPTRNGGQQTAVPTVYMQEVGRRNSVMILVPTSETYRRILFLLIEAKQYAAVFGMSPTQIIYLRVMITAGFIVFAAVKSLLIIMVLI